MTKTLTTERQQFEEWFNEEMALHVTESNATAVRLMWKAWQARSALAANREAQPVYQCRFFTTDIDGKQIGEWQDMDKGFYDQYDPHCRRVLFTAPPAPAVPEGMTGSIAMTQYRIKPSNYKQWVKGYNACRAAMLAQPVSQGYKLPDGFKLMPIEMTDEIAEAIAMEARCCGGIALCIYEAALAAAPEGGNG